MIGRHLTLADSAHLSLTWNDQNDYFNFLVRQRQKEGRKMVNPCEFSNVSDDEGNDTEKTEMQDSSPSPAPSFEEEDWDTEINQLNMPYGRYPYRLIRFTSDVPVCLPLQCIGLLQYTLS